MPIVPGERNKYAIAMLPTSNVFQKGHSMELIIRNQDDMRSKIARSGVNMFPFMQSVTHTIYFGESYLLLPIIPADE